MILIKVWWCILINDEFDLDKATSYKQLDEFVRNKRAKRNSIIILRCKNSKGLTTDFINKVRKRYGNEFAKQKV